MISCLLVAVIWRLALLIERGSSKSLWSAIVPSSFLGCCTLDPDADDIVVPAPKF